jgi:hypothetical protein
MATGGRTRAVLKLLIEWVIGELNWVVIYGIELG